MRLKKLTIQAFGPFKDKTVIDLGNAICIKTKDFVGLKIYTSWKDIIVNKFAVTSFDNISSFVKEVKKYHNETIDTIISDLNITFVESDDKEEEICIKANKPIPVTMYSDK